MTHTCVHDREGKSLINENRLQASFLAVISFFYRLGGFSTFFQCRDEPFSLTHSSVSILTLQEVGKLVAVIGDEVSIQNPCCIHCASDPFVGILAMLERDSILRPSLC